MSIDVSSIARVGAGSFARLLEAPIDAGRSLLEPVRESFEGSFLERPLRVEAADVASALRAVSLSPKTKLTSSRVDGGTVELLVAGRLDYRATVADALAALEREKEDASFTVVRDTKKGELRVTGRVSPWALNGWLEVLLSIAMAAETLDGEGRAAVLALDDDFDETNAAHLYRVEEGSLVVEELDPPNDGFEATRDAFEPYGIAVEE